MYLQSDIYLFYTHHYRLYIGNESAKIVSPKIQDRPSISTAAESKETIGDILTLELQRTQENVAKLLGPLGSEQKFRTIRLKRLLKSVQNLNFQIETLFPAKLSNDINDDEPQGSRRYARRVTYPFPEKVDYGEIVDVAPIGHQLFRESYSPKKRHGAKFCHRKNTRLQEIPMVIYLMNMVIFIFCGILFVYAVFYSYQ